MTSEWEAIRPTPEDLDFKGVTSRYAESEGVVIDEKKVPERLRHLIGYAKHWAIDDGNERGNLMWLTPTEELQAFVNAVWPLGEEIDSWCRVHRDDIACQDEVYLFDKMTEAAAEVNALHVDVDEDRGNSASCEV